MNGTVEGLVESERLVRMLRALQCDCENTDGWEAAALDIQEAINTILSLQSQLVASREALTEGVTCLTWIAGLGYEGAPDIAMRRAAKESLERIAALTIGVGD